MVCMQAQGSAAGGVCSPPPHPAVVMQQQSNQELGVQTVLHSAAADLLCMVAGSCVGGLVPGESPSVKSSSPWWLNVKALHST
jgi:hypothetical protein